MTDPHNLHEVLHAVETAWAQGGPAAVRPWCVDDPALLVFDRNGHHYRGTDLWAMSPSPWQAPAGERTVDHRGPTAWVSYAADTLSAPRDSTERSAHGSLASSLTRSAPRDSTERSAHGSLTRTSLVLVHRPDGWAISHVHQSAASPGPRPGGI